MRDTGTERWWLYLSIPLAVFVATAAVGGLFWPGVYARETALWAAEGKGGDAVNLLVVVPILAVTTSLTVRRSKSAQLIWMGTVMFLLYNFLIYCIAVHFNRLFLVYCAALGLSFYALVGSLKSLPVSDISGDSSSRFPRKTTVTVLLLIAFVFGVQWFREIIPALHSGEAPNSVRDAGLLTSPVHVLDLSIVLPGIIVTAIMLARRRPIGIVLAPVLMVFAILMLIGISGMIFAMRSKGLVTHDAGAIVFLAAATALSILLAFYLRRL
jgi:hypothetical protein